jgi:hypothetical protein
MTHFLILNSYESIDEKEAPLLMSYSVLDTNFDKFGINPLKNLK